MKTTIVKIVLLSLCSTASPVVLAAESRGSPDVVIEWNALLQSNMPTSAGVNTPRYYAMLHIAMFDAANAIDRKYTQYRARIWFVPRAASAEAAAAQAAHDVLTALIPTAEPAFTAALDARLANSAGWSANVGRAVGRYAAQQILSWREGDGAIGPGPAYQPAPLPGLWQPTPPSFGAAQFTQAGDVEPFALLTATQYLPRPPPLLNSAEYAANFDEVKLLGSATSTARTAEQTLLARLFAPSGYSTQHWVIWNTLARDMAVSQRMSLVDTARLFALLNVSIHDGVQTSHASKYVYGLWRPITAIRRADEDANPSTLADANWTPLITTPAYPSHASNQTCVGTSAARALERALGSDEMSFTATWTGTGGNANVVRAYSRFSALAEDQARSRVYAGIHFTFELTASQESCMKVADYVYSHYMRPRSSPFH